MHFSDVSSNLIFLADGNAFPRVGRDALEALAYCASQGCVNISGGDGLLPLLPKGRVTDLVVQSQHPQFWCNLPIPVQATQVRLLSQQPRAFSLALERHDVLHLSLS